MKTLPFNNPPEDDEQEQEGITLIPPASVLSQNDMKEHIQMGSITDHYCELNLGQPQDCQKPLLAFLKSTLAHASHSASSGTNAPVQFHWVFLGDSTMAQLYWMVFLHGRSSFDASSKREYRERCDAVQHYFQTQPPDPWQPPGPGEGPIHFGKTHPGCTDCRKCYNSFIGGVQSEESENNDHHNTNSSTAVGNNTAPYHTAEFLVVEFAKDVEFQSAHTRTTQQTVARYLSSSSPPLTTTVTSMSRGKRINTCIVNTGLHDAAIPNMTKEIYLNHVKEYLQLLLVGHTSDDETLSSSTSSSPCSGGIVWISLSSVLESADYPQRNDILRDWNAAVFQHITSQQQQRRTQPMFFYLDVWNETFRSQHLDNIHLKRSYYKGLADIWNSAIEQRSA